MKKIISAGLATILAASALTTAAFADEVKITAEGTVAKPAIKVTMPKSMAFVFNPYGLKVDVKGKIDATNGKETTMVGSYAFETVEADQAGWKIVNATGADLQVAVYAYSTNKADAEFLVLDKNAVEADVPAAESGKRAVKVELQAGDVAIPLQKDALAAGTKLWSVAAADAALASADNTKKLAALTELEAGTADAPGALYISVAGETVNPDKLIWSEKDAVKINFVFGFEIKEPDAAP